MNTIDKLLENKKNMLDINKEDDKYLIDFLNNFDNIKNHLLFNNCTHIYIKYYKNDYYYGGNIIFFCISLEEENDYINNDFTISHFINDNYYHISYQCDDISFSCDSWKEIEKFMNLYMHKNKNVVVNYINNINGYENTRPNFEDEYYHPNDGY
jgi:hypothetical protein